MNLERFPVFAALGEEERELVAAAAEEVDVPAGELRLSAFAEDAAGDIEALPLLKNAHVATYATAIREQGAGDGRPDAGTRRRPR